MPVSSGKHGGFLCLKKNQKPTSQVACVMRREDSGEKKKRRRRGNEQPVLKASWETQARVLLGKHKRHLRKRREFQRKQKSISWNTVSTYVY